MTGTPLGIGLLVLGILLLLAVAVAARALYRRFRHITLEIYRRLEAIERAVGSVSMSVSVPQQDLSVLLAEAGLLREQLTRVAFATRSSNVMATEIVRAHLRALGEETVPPVPIGYALSRAARSVDPLVLRRGDSRTVICTLALGQAYFDKVLPGLTSQQYYAEAHGLSFAILSDLPSYMGRPPAWMKIALIVNLFDQGFDRVVYIDADALVTNAEFDVGTVFGARNPNGSLTLAEDEDGINCGVMFLEDGPATRRLLDLVWMFDADVENGTWEQFALKSLMDMSASVSRHVTYVADPRRFNSFPIERRLFHRTMDKSVWRPGDFLCHFSGIRSPELERLMAQYASSIAPLQYYKCDG